uniref:Uncharacterized protein n=1 Tax=Timema cristinae TaxID=61476 RepID=A0A7R9CYU0_TIMCR|nr:unnamed protein product [Timema cristinae]
MTVYNGVPVTVAQPGVVYGYPPAGPGGQNPYQQPYNFQTQYQPSAYQQPGYQQPGYPHSQYPQQPGMAPPAYSEPADPQSHPAPHEKY